jgi:hypothetical protein
MKVINYCLIGICVLLYSCISSTVDNTNKPIYFNLKEYIEQEEARLTSSKTHLQKVASVDSISQTIQITQPDWELELDIFASSDINKPSWVGSYEIQITDTLDTYTAHLEELKTQKLRIYKKEDGSVRNIEIFNHTKNSLYELTEHLKYYPTGYYSIYRTQQTRFLSDDIFEIEGYF